MSCTKQAVLIDGGRTRYVKIDVPMDTGKDSTRPPVSDAIGLPFVTIKRDAEHGSACLVNQHATYLNIALDTGFAPMEWQNRVGTVVVCDPGPVDFTSDQLDKVINAVTSLLDDFGDEEAWEHGYPTVAEAKAKLRSRFSN